MTVTVSSTVLPPPTFLGRNTTCRSVSSLMSQLLIPSSTIVPSLQKRLFAPQIMYFPENILTSPLIGGVTVSEVLGWIESLKANDPFTAYSILKNAPVELSPLL